MVICPSDPLKKYVSDWSSIKSSNCSYEIVTFQMKPSDTNTIFLRCKIHGHLGYPCGLIFDGVQKRTKKIR